MKIGIDEVVGSNPTQSIFITLRNYGIILSLFWVVVRQNLSAKTLFPSAIGTFSWLRFWFWLGVSTATSSVSIKDRKGI